MKGFDRYGMPANSESLFNPRLNLYLCGTYLITLASSSSLNGQTAEVAQDGAHVQQQGDALCWHDHNQDCVSAEALLPRPALPQTTERSSEEHIVRAYHFGPKSCWSREADLYYMKYRQAIRLLRVLKDALDSTDLTDSGPMMHIVQPGETLAAIARTCSTTVEQVLAVNPDIPSADTVQPNDCIALPVPYLLPKLYVVKHGDTLQSVSRAQGVSCHRLLLANPELQSPAVFTPGWVLLLPGLRTPADTTSLQQSQASASAAVHALHMAQLMQTVTTAAAAANTAALSSPPLPSGNNTRASRAGSGAAAALMTSSQSLSAAAAGAGVKASAAAGGGGGNGGIGGGMAHAVALAGWRLGHSLGLGDQIPTPRRGPPLRGQETTRQDWQQQQPQAGQQQQQAGQQQQQQQQVGLGLAYLRSHLGYGGGLAEQQQQQQQQQQCGPSALVPPVFLT